MNCLWHPDSVRVKHTLRLSGSPDMLRMRVQLGLKLPEPADDALPARLNHSWGVLRPPAATKAWNAAEYLGCHRESAGRFWMMSSAAHWIRSSSRVRVTSLSGQRM